MSYDTVDREATPTSMFRTEEDVLRRCERVLTNLNSNPETLTATVLDRLVDEEMFSQGTYLDALCAYVRARAAMAKAEMTYEELGIRPDRDMAGNFAQLLDRVEDNLLLAQARCKELCAPEEWKAIDEAATAEEKEREVC